MVKYCSKARAFFPQPLTGRFLDAGFFHRNVKHRIGRDVTRVNALHLSRLTTGSRRTGGISGNIGDKSVLYLLFDKDSLHKINISENLGFRGLY